jgi:CXXX repeat modification system protein
MKPKKQKPVVIRAKFEALVEKLKALNAPVATVTAGELALIVNLYAESDALRAGLAKNQLEKQKWWKCICRKYELDSSKENYSINHETGKITKIGVGGGSGWMNPR